MEYFNTYADTRSHQAWKFISKRIPSARLIEKEKSVLMRFLNLFISLWNPNFMRMTTVVGNRIYMPKDSMSRSNCWYILLHEYIHMYDSSVIGKLPFFFRYFFPQILSILSLLSIFAILNPWFLLFILFLLFLMPLPSKGRVEIERRGYTMSLLAMRHAGGVRALVNALDEYENIFKGASYYYMLQDPKKWEAIKTEWELIPHRVYYLKENIERSIKIDLLYKLSPLTGVSPQIAGEPFLQVIEQSGLFTSPLKIKN